MDYSARASQFDSLSMVTAGCQSVAFMISAKCAVFPRSWSPAQLHSATMF